MSHSLSDHIKALAQKVAYGHTSKDRAKYIIAMESAETKAMFWAEVKLWEELLWDATEEVA